MDDIDADFFMATLNYGFGGTGFNFTLAREPFVYVNRFWYDCNDIRLPDIKRATRKGGPNALNIWLCNLEDVDTVGFAFFPPALLYNPFGDGIGTFC